MIPTYDTKLPIMPCEIYNIDKYHFDIDIWLISGDNKSQMDIVSFK